MDDVAELAVLADVDAWIGEHECPVGARHAIVLVCGDQLHRGWIDAEFVTKLTLSDRERGILREACAWPRLRQRVTKGADRAISCDRDAPLLRTLRDVPAEGREAHIPHRRRQRSAGQRAIDVWSRLAPDELVPRPLLPIVVRELHHGQALPLGSERDSACGERLFRDRNRGCAVDRQHRRIDAKGRKRQP